MTYAWKCRECGWRGESSSRDDPPEHGCAGGVVRDYRAENVGVDRTSLK